MFNLISIREIYISLYKQTHFQLRLLPSVSWPIYMSIYQDIRFVFCAWHLSDFPRFFLLVYNSNSRKPFKRPSGNMLCFFFFFFVLFRKYSPCIARDAFEVLFHFQSENDLIFKYISSSISRIIILYVQNLNFVFHSETFFAHYNAPPSTSFLTFFIWLSF